MMKRRRSNVWAILGMVSWAGTAMPAARAVDAAPSGAAAKLDVERVLGDSAANRAELENERRGLEAAMTRAVEPGDKAAAHLALANWLLAAPTARPATRWFLGMSTPEDLQAIATSAGEARTHLDDAEKLVPERDRVRGNSLRILKAFAELMAAVGQADGAEGWPELALGLSEARESENPQIASAATLWQAMAWIQAGRRPRALTTLPDALAKPDYPFDFISRLLRCRLLGEEGQYGAAMSLASRVGSICDSWYPREKPNVRASRKRLAALVQLQLGQEWMKKLQTATQPAEAGLLADLLARIRKQHFPDEDREAEVFALRAAIPILVKAPDVSPAAPERHLASPSEPDEPETAPAEPQDEER